MSLPNGTRLGPYEIVSLLGRGGMGEVYRARDTRLDRLVALKTVRAEFATAVESRLRFEREARSIARLSHPHICALFDVGHADDVEYLVMELLEGETLADLLRAGPLPAARVLQAGQEIATALFAAHQQGIVHRDLKPANVMMTRSGVKLVDFGLAHAAAPPVAETGEVETVTSAGRLTVQGAFVGTPAYMAPEVLRGQPADARSDVFALGTVLYEMTAGQRPFKGETTMDLAAAITNQEPAPVLEGRSDLSVAFGRLVHECLAKDPERRWQSAGDVALHLKGMIDAPAARPTEAGRGVVRFLPWLVAAAGVTLALAAPWRTDQPAPAAGRVDLEIVPPANRTFAYTVENVHFALAPAGDRLAFIVSEPEGPSRIWIRSPASIDARPLAGTDGASSLFWSADGRSLAFVAGNSLKRLELSSNAAVQVSEVKSNLGFSGAWGLDGRLLFASVEGEALYSVPTSGGTPIVVATPDASKGEIRLQFPVFLPDGRRYLYLAQHKDGSGQLLLGEDGKAPRSVGAVQSNFAFVDSEHLVYASDGTLIVRRFDPASLTLVGDAVAVADSVRYFQTTGVANFAAAGGTIVYQDQRDQSRVAWFDRTGREGDSVGTTGDYLDLRLLPTGREALLSRALPRTGTIDLWQLDLERGTETRVTLDDAQTETYGLLSPDGTTLVYSVPQAGSPRLVRQDMSSGRTDTLLPGDQFQIVEDISPDGRVLAYRERASTGAFTLWTMALDGSSPPAPLRASPFNSWGFRFSPDGSLYTFGSNETGHPEIYLSSVGGGPVRRVSTDGGVSARWASSGREIIYQSSDGRIVSVRLTDPGSLDLGAPTTLFAVGRTWLGFEVVGDRLLALVRDIVADQQPLRAILGWGPR